MATLRQELGDYGEAAVVQSCLCGRCKRDRTLRKLPPNFKCADVICGFCGFMAQVKAATSTTLEVLPDRILGGAWSVQRERMDSGIYFPLFVVLQRKAQKGHSIFYLSADLQTRDMFVARNPLSAGARRAGWQGFFYDLRTVKERFVRLL
jgi:type II restriction enzyme